MIFTFAGCELKSVIIGTFNITDSDGDSTGSVIFKDDGCYSKGTIAGNYEIDAPSARLIRKKIVE